MEVLKMIDTLNTKNYVELLMKRTNAGYLLSDDCAAVINSQ